MAEDETRETQDQETEPGESSSASRGLVEGDSLSDPRIRIHVLVVPCSASATARA